MKRLHLIEIEDQSWCPAAYSRWRDGLFAVCTNQDAALPGDRSTFSASSPNVQR
jgi:hypothetical protein